MDCHGVGRVRISRFLFTSVPYPMAASKNGSGGGTYLTVHLRPQVQAGTVNSALQCADRAAGRASSFFVTLLFDSDHTKGFFLVPRQALEGDVKLAQFGPVVLRSRDTHLRYLVEVTVLTPASHAGDEVIGHYPEHPGRKFVPATKESLAASAFIATSCTKSSAAARFLVRAIANPRIFGRNAVS